MNVQTLQEIAEEIYKDRNLYEGYPSAYTDTQQMGNYVVLTFNTNKAYHIESMLFHENQVLVIKNITSYPFKKKGIGRNLVEATEEIASMMNLKYSFITHNGAPGFWKEMKYEHIPYEDARQILPPSLTINTPNDIVYKSLPIITK